MKVTNMNEGGIPKRLLIIDDEIDVCEILSVRLNHSGYAVESALDGPSAIEKIDDFSPDGIILDLNLPGMNGWEVCQEIRTHFPETQIPILILTGNKLEEHIVMAKKYGANEVLEKTVNFNHFYETK